MVLKGTPKEDDGDGEQLVGPFLYASVLAVCHANITYVGPGAVDYQPHQMDCLWVRWYEQLDLGKTGWSCRKLDQAHFPSQTI